jgi:Ca2+-binding RTX toxin-like protein
VAGATIHGSGGNDTIDATNTVAGQALPTGEADIIKGNAGSDTIHGLAGDDALSGNAGDDYLDGGTGADAMFGGAGDDTYVVDNAADKTAEGATGDGEDLVVSSVGRTLGAGLENLTLSGAASVHGTGNDAANELTGNTGDNTLRGLAGSDLLDGGEGADRLYGGLGDDTYVVDNADDDVIEGASDDGDDTVMSSVGRTLDANLENLTLTGSDDINGKGNSLGNSLVGNDGANALRGEAGADVIDGGAGRDLLFGGADGDTFVFSHVADTGLGGANRDQIRDFGVGDLIDLTGMAAEAGVAFAFIGGAAFSNVAGQVRQLSAGANTLVAGDVNGDKVADFSFLLTGSHTLQSSDFML